MEGEYVILAMCSWFRISWFSIICWLCWRASGNKWITYVDMLRPLKNHGLSVFILTYTPWLLCHGFASVRILGLPMSDSVWNCGRSLVLWVPGISGSIGNGILGEYFPEREYNLLNPKRTRKRPKFQPCPWSLCRCTDIRHFKQCLCLAQLFWWRSCLYRAGHISVSARNTQGIESISLLHTHWTSGLSFCWVCTMSASIPYDIILTIACLIGYSSSSTVINACTHSQQPNTNHPRFLLILRDSDHCHHSPMDGPPGHFATWRYQFVLPSQLEA